jgi:hypothetical protein
LLRLLVAAACCAALAAQAASEPPPLAKDLGVDAAEPAARTRVFEDVVVAPIPISNPTVGTGLAVVVMPFYHLGAQSPLSNTAFAAGYTSSGSRGIGAAQSTRLRGDTLRLDGYLGYVDIRYRFFGTGSAAGSAGQSVPIEQQGYAFVPELLFRVAGRTFLGVRYRGIRVDTAIDTAAPPPEFASFEGLGTTIDSSGLGPVAVFDSRDNEMNPASGVFAAFRGNYARRDLGSDLDYETFTLAANHYRRVGRGVLALRAYACHASDGTPLFDLCFFGAGTDLRGYEAGRYRDRSMFAVQGEYRFPLRGRFGAVVFAGTGKVAPSFDDMGNEPSLPSVGAGLRWLAAETARVNLSVDFARGRDESTVYVYVKEAF